MFDPSWLRAAQPSTGGGGWRRGGRGGAERRRGGRPEIQLRPRLPADPAGHHAEGAAQGWTCGAWGRRAGHPLPGERSSLTLLVVFACDTRDSQKQTSFLLVSLLRQGKNFVGDLLTDGKIRWVETGQIFNSPSAWATHCKRLVNPAKKSGCGWASVRYRGQKLVQYKTTWLHKYQPTADLVRQQLKYRLCCFFFLSYPQHEDNKNCLIGTIFFKFHVIIFFSAVSIQH